MVTAIPSLRVQEGDRQARIRQILDRNAQGGLEPAAAIPLSDGGLLALAEADGSQAMTLIYERYGQRVLRYCAIQLSEREFAADDTFERLLRHIQSGNQRIALTASPPSSRPLLDIR